MDWLRLYIDVIDDPKIAKMSATTYQLFTFFLCLARKEDKNGELRQSDDEIAWRLRRPAKQVKRAISDLIELSILRRIDGGIEIVNWQKRQYKSDNVNERVKRYRAKTETLHETLESRYRADTDTDTEQSKPPVDNQKNGDGSFQEKLKEAFSKIQQKKPDWNFHHQVYLFIQTHLKHGNPDALIHCLESLHKQLEAGNEIKHPKPYLDAAMKIENGKHNAREHTARAEELKIKPGEIQGINQILGAMIGGQAK